jgi:predicted transcriptional regulator of viral defense system
VSIDDLRRRAAAAGGVFTPADAAACGFSRSAVRHRLAIGEWVRLRRGVFAESAAIAGDHTATEIARVAAAIAAVGPGAAASHHSAAVLHGLALYGRRPSYVAVTTNKRIPTSCDSLEWLRVRRSALPDDHVVHVCGVPVTSVARTAVDVARGRSLRTAVVVLDAALRVGCERGRLEDVVRSQRRWPGVTGARQALVLADEGSESPLESLAHVCQFEAGLPRPHTQVELRDPDGFIGRVDDYWPALQLVGESDGLLKYTSPEVLRAEKLRQERLERRGLTVVRVTYADVTTDAARTRARYRAAVPAQHFAERMVAPRRSRGRRSDHSVGKVVGWERDDGRGRMGG